MSVEVHECMATALIKLSEDKPLSAISVTELCKTAGVSRMAYYRNYTSKEEILRLRLSDLIEEYRQVTEPLLKTGALWHSIGHLGTCFEFFRRHSDIMDGLFRLGYQGYLVDSIADFLIGRWGNGTPEGDYVLTAFAGSICACYPLWAKRDFAESPKRMAEVLGRFYVSIPELK